MTSKEDVLRAISSVVCPCTTQVGLTLTASKVGLIRSVNISRGVVRIKFVADDMTCIYMPGVLGELKATVEKMEGVKRVDVEVSKDSIWELEMMPKEIREMLQEHYRQKMQNEHLIPWALRDNRSDDP